MTTRSYSLLAAAVAILLLTVLSGPPAPSSATESGGTVATESSPVESAPVLELAAAGLIIKPHHYNLCSNNCSEQRLASLTLARYLVDEDDAWSLSLNEACFSDVMNLLRESTRFPDLNYTFTVTKYNVPGCGTYGNAVLTIGNRVWNAEYQYALQGTGRGNCIVGEKVECRKMVCSRYDVFGIITQACSTHLLNSNDSTALEQSRDYTYMATYWAGNYFRILAGDFNVNPDQLRRDGNYFLPYTSGTSGYTHDAHGALNEQLDYIYVQDGPYVPPVQAFCPRDRSDHCYTSTAVYF